MSDGARYSDTMYSDRISSAKASGKDLFTHDVDVKTGRTEAKCHEKLDPSKLNKAGKNVREAFDSDLYPNSRAIAILFDQTGSMSGVPKQFINKLDKLMGFVVKKGVEDPQILFGAIGDATNNETAPLQVGQFEGSNELDEVLSLIYLESKGGGSIQESYELAMYFMARHTDMDCVNKRGDKGYLFIIGDETPYPFVSKSQVKKFIGDDLQADIPTSEILEELREKFEVFWVIPANTSHANDRKVIEPMQAMFGQNFLRLDNPDDVCELIAGTIAVTEGFDLDEISSDLKSAGADSGSTDRASTALVAYAASRGTALSKAEVIGDLPVSTDSSSDDSVARL